MTEGFLTGATVAPPRFGRRAVVSIIENSKPLITIFGYNDDEPQPFGMRMAFQVDRALKSMADTARIRIWNLGSEKRGMLAQRSLFWVRQDPIRYLRLEAGYNGGHTGVIFNGGIVRVINTREGPDWITELECSAVFGQALLNTFNKSWGGFSGTPTKTVLSEMFSSAGYKSVTFSPAADAVLSNKKQPTLAVVGSAFRSARRLLVSHGLTFNIDVDGVTVYAQAEPRGTTEEFLDISEVTGLLGTPKVTDMGTEFRSLLDPRLKPGQLVLIDSQTLRDSLSVTDSSLGRKFTAWQVKVVGDTHSDDWYCDVIAYFHPMLSQLATSVLGPTLLG